MGQTKSKGKVYIQEEQQQAILKNHNSLSYVQQIYQKQYKLNTLRNSQGSINVDNLTINDKYKLKFSSIKQQEIQNKDIDTLTYNNLLITDFAVKNEQNSKDYEMNLQQIQSQLGQSSYSNTTFKNSNNNLQKFLTNTRGKKQNVLWKRYQEIFATQKGKKLGLKDFQIFYNKTQLKVPKNSMQIGNLQNCYFLSAVHCLAQIHPTLLVSLFNMNQTNANENYQSFQAINLIHDGNWKQQVVDHNFPFYQVSMVANKSKQNQEIFSKLNNLTEMWFPLLEKAYAQQFGSYCSIAQGMFGHALRDLCGAPYKYKVRMIESQDDLELYNWIIQELGQNNLIYISNEQNSRIIIDDAQTPNNNVKTPQYSYLILEAHEIQSQNGIDDSEYILKILNPWKSDKEHGFQEWEGDWSQNSSKWSPQLKEQLKYQGIQHKDEEDIFWISVFDLKQIFSQYCSCKIRPSYFYSSYQCESQDRALSQSITYDLFSFQIDQDITKGFLSINQKDINNFSDTNQKKQYTQYSLVRIILMNLSKDNQIEQITDYTIDNERDVTLDFDKDGIKQGKYLVYVEIDWIQNITREFTISMYGQEKVKFTNIKITDQLYKQKILENIIFLHQQTEEPKRKTKIKQDIYRVSGSLAGYPYFYYVNYSETQILRENVDLLKRQYLEIDNNTRILQNYNHNSQNLDSENDFKEDDDDEEDDENYVEKGKNNKIQNRKRNVSELFPSSHEFKVILLPGKSKIFKFRATLEGSGVYTYQSSVRNIILDKHQFVTQQQFKELLIFNTLKNPTKIKQKQMNGHYMNVFVHTYIYWGGVCFLYINNTKQKTFVEDLKIDVKNLTFLSLDSDKHHKQLNVVQQKQRIEIPAREVFFINLKCIDKFQEVSYKFKSSFFLQ